MVYYASCCKESLEICYECHSVTCKHRGITRSIATQRIARTWTVRRVINASPDPTGLTCTFRNGIRGGSNRLAPRPVFARKNDDFSTKEEGQRRGLYGRLSVTRERKASCVTRVLSVVVPLRSDPLNLGCRGFFFFRSSDEERDRYPRLYYKYTCNSASSPTVLSVYLSDRPPIYMSA